jgi:hypothetical protein
LLYFIATLFKSSIDLNGPKFLIFLLVLVVLIGSVLSMSLNELDNDNFSIGSSTLYTLFNKQKKTGNAKQNASEKQKETKN